MAKKGMNFLIIIIAVILVIYFFPNILNITGQTTISLPNCQISDDCPIPIKNTCTGFFTGCNNNICTYDRTVEDVVVCENELVTILLEQQKLEDIDRIPIEGVNRFIFGVNYPRKWFNLGIERFEAEIDFECDILEELGTIRFPNPSSSCYTATAEYGGQSWDLNDLDEFFIRDNVKVTYYAGGQVSKKDTEFLSKKTLSSQFVFEVDNPLEINLLDTQEVLHNVDKDVLLSVKNNLPDGIVMMKIKQTAKRTNQIFPEQRIDKDVVEGLNEVSFEMDTSQLGIQRFEVQSFYKITLNNREILLPSDTVIFNYLVVEELSGFSGGVIVDYEEPVVEVSDGITFDEEVLGMPLWILIVIIIGVVILIRKIK